MQTYQDLENTMQTLTPMERQMILAEAYHYAWYNEDAYKELQDYLNKWGSMMTKPVFFNQTNNNDTETTSA